MYSTSGLNHSKDERIAQILVFESYRIYVSNNPYPFFFTFKIDPGSPPCAMLQFAWETERLSGKCMGLVSVIDIGLHFPCPRYLAGDLNFGI